MTHPETVVCTYPVKIGMEQEFESLLKKHWPTLTNAGLILKDPAQILKRTDKKSNETTYIEIFTWKDAAAADEAHHVPEVQAVWETMGKMIREIDGELGWDFRHYRRISPDYQQ